MAGLGIAAVEIELLTVFIIAAAVGIFVSKMSRVPYTIALLLAGLAVSIFGIQFDIQLSHDIIFLVLLPPLLFEGAATMDLERFQRNMMPVFVMAVFGLIISILLLGWLGSQAFGFPILISLLFASMILPTDPVSVLALFKDIGAPKRLSVLVEGESLFNDGVGVVIFTAILALVQESQQTGLALGEMISAARIGEIGIDIVTSSLGGLAVGAVVGYMVYRIMVHLDEHMTEIILTVILAYGSFLLAEHFLHFSGVIATVAAGLLIGNRGAEHAMSPQTKISVFDTWETAAFLVNTFIFLLIGAKTPVGQLIEHAWLIAIAAFLVLAVRAVTTYPIMAIVNRATDHPVPLNYQHVIVWAGLHASIPIALVLGLPQGTPYLEELRAMVFGVAAFSLVVQGLSMSRFLDYFDVIRKTEAEELYELLIGRARAVDNALEALEDLNGRNEIPGPVFTAFKQKYRSEKEDLGQAISQLLNEYPEIREEEIRAGERKVLKQEKSAVMDAMRTGAIDDTVAEHLLEEINFKLDRVSSGGKALQTDETEAWRKKVAEFGLDLEDQTD